MSHSRFWRTLAWLELSSRCTLKPAKHQQQHQQPCQLQQQEPPQLGGQRLLQLLRLWQEVLVIRSRHLASKCFCLTQRISHTPLQQQQQPPSLPQQQATNPGHHHPPQEPLLQQIHHHCQLAGQDLLLQGALLPIHSP